MSVWDNIRQEINTNIADNDQQLITAEKVRTTLIDIVDETADLIESIEYDLNNNIQAGTYQFLQDHYYTKIEVNDLFDEQLDIINDQVIYLEDEDAVVLDSCYAYTVSYCNSNFYDKTESDKLYKPTGVFFYFGDTGENECNCKVSYVNFINEDGPEGDFYLIECYARYGLDDSILFNFNRPYGSMYSCTYSIGLYDTAIEAFTKALGPGHTPQIHKFDKTITLTTDYPSKYYTGNGIIMVANVDCDDEYNGDITFSLVSAYNQANVPLNINVGFRCWVQDVQ